jgi:hypothetical protein
MNYTLDQLEKAGFTFTGFDRIEPIGIGYLQKKAFELDVKIEGLAAFRLENGRWALFLRPNYVKGFISEAML